MRRPHHGNAAVWAMRRFFTNAANAILDQNPTSSGRVGRVVHELSQVARLSHALCSRGNRMPLQRRPRGAAADQSAQIPVVAAVPVSMTLSTTVLFGAVTRTTLLFGPGVG
jgi:hypothetical protein